MKNLAKNQKLGKHVVQSFGYFLACNSRQEIIGISDNFIEFIGMSPRFYIGQEISSLLSRHFPTAKKKISGSIFSLLKSEIVNKIIQHQINGIKYSLNISKYGDCIFLEWESQKSDGITARQMNDLTQLLDNRTSHIWSSVCSIVQNITKFDRTLLFQINESGIGKMLKEITVLDQNHFLGKQFSEQFMPPDVINYYQSAAFRYCPNIFKETSVLYSSSEDTDILKSQFAPLPDLHVKYLRGLGISSLVVFPIIINDQLWGMIIGHNYNEKSISLRKRQFCAFVVQYASNKYGNILQKQVLEQHDQIKDFELDLKGRLMFSKSINCVLVQNMDILCSTIQADGIAVLHSGDIFTQGLCPDENQILQIKQIIGSLDKKPIFKDYNFKSRYERNIDGVLPFAGLLALQVANRDDYYIFWFRKEKVSQILQIYPDCHVSEENLQSQNFCKTEEETVLNSAIPWSQNDLYFVDSLRKLVHDTILLKSREQEKFNEELIAMNNELEMLTFTLSHDLKNPLSIIKLGMQIIKEGHIVTEQEKQRWAKTILDGVNNIETIIDGMLKLGKAKSFPLIKVPVPVANMIRNITEEAKILYQSSTCIVKSGKLLPVWGEKSLVYQIFLNIIGNAIKYSSTQENPLIEINSYQMNDNVYYNIIDNGIGIPEKYLSRVFNVFVRANNTDQFTGTGVGLCLVKRIMEKLGGELFIESKIDIGTIITLVFPSVGDLPKSIYLDQNHNPI